MINFIRKKIRSKKQTLKNEKLIEKLKEDHRKLLKLFNDVEESVELCKQKKKRKEYCVKKFDAFLNELSLHLILENSQLYEHLEIKYKYCDIRRMKHIKEEIPSHSELLKEIKFSLLAEDYQKAEQNLHTLKLFLLARIKFEEEKLYELYEKTFPCERIKYKLYY
jgi:transcriptional regulator of heat shock response